ncbi:MAG TPA: acetyl-CoA C-acyltransferase [Aromatoleum sp.]|uniref:acetyl-CoA C-acyltransferase n=1 Tax=Aromatoleum sp. TaxID=2307007 RepID=UPI002B46670E|nr:acetyl-CoA C-acyltransferase [Aromatoleum sp.]HJV25198.1 acetyl-CoA C-acyltransferase [Aromatoleum sp.]
MIDPVVIVAARRTPIGAFQGQFASVTAPQLGSAAIAGALADLGDKLADIDEAVLGCCLMAGVKQAPARQAVLGAGLPQSVPATTLTKMCGSGMKATMLVHDMLLAGSCTVGLAGGMESMSNAPYVLSRAREGYRLGHGELLDHMFLDGLEDAYEGRLMGYYADVSASEHGISRERQDAYASESVRRAQHAVASGAFRNEIAPVTVVGRKGSIALADDETPGKCDIARIPQLKAAFRKDGTVTPANASSISDGAAALVLMRESEAVRRGLAPLARIRAHATHAQAPGQFTTAPATSIRSALAKAGWRIGDVDLFEINEAFAVVTLLAIDELDLSPDKVNVNGGACAMGHPIGATGARILVTLIHVLRNRGLKRGIASLCIGGGEATAVAVEIL